MAHPDRLDGSSDPSPADWIGQPAEVVYARLLERDELGIEATCRSVLRDRALLLELSVVYAEALREVAFECEIASLEDATDGWIEHSVVRATDRLLDRQRSEEDAGLPFDPEDYRILRGIFGLAPAEGRRASVHFHALPTRLRRVFQVLILDDRPLADATELGLGKTPELLQAILTAFEAVGATISPERMPLGLRGEG